MGPFGEACVSSEYDVDDVLLLLEPVRVFFVVFVILVLLLFRSIWRCQLEGFAQDHALPRRVAALGVDWAPFVMKDLVELILRLFILLTTRSVIHSTDCIVRLALARRIPLVVGPSTVVVTLSVVVVVTASEAAALLLLFICPALDHVA
jgi:hypothetical protein